MSLPTLSDLPAYIRDEHHGRGFAIFFDGQCCGWSLNLAHRTTPEQITSWRPGCIALAMSLHELGRRYIAIGGSYHSGADAWEPYELGHPTYDREVVAGARRILGRFALNPTAA